ncbi:MAG: CPBP family intramembrane metalloprotease [Planctomycetaceae bacterium]|nr:CPBP family intramembrane metalloprotease [Planctomycetaceae bacterium]
MSSQQPDRFVKWNLLDFLLLFFLYNVLTFVCVVVTMACAVVIDSMADNRGHSPLVIKIEKDGGQPRLVHKIEKKETTAEHPLTQLIQQGRSNPAVLLIALLVGVITTPIVEEFLFRLVLQSSIINTDKYGGWYNSISAALSIFITSLLFAALHGLPPKEMTLEALQAMMLGAMIGGVLFLIAGIAYLVVVRKTDARDLGWDDKHLLSDIETAARWAVFVMPAVMLIHITAKALLPNAATDPIPLFFFSLVLGYLFYKTRRLAPPVFLHAFFNGFNLMILLVFG